MLEEMSTEEIAAIAICAGVLTVRGNRTSHAAVVARQLGKACVTGCSGLRFDASRQTMSSGDLTISSGDLVTLDSNTGRLYQGERELLVEYPSPWLDQIGHWRR